MIKYRNQYLDIAIGAIALFLGGAAFSHWLAYYRYPYMRCINIFELHFHKNEGETLELGVDSIDPQSAEPKPHLKLNFVSKHWRGEYGPPRSFWLHGVLLGYLILVVSCLLGEGTGLYLGRLFFIVIGIWQIGGVWRSAKRQGGLWAAKYNASIGAVLLWFMSSYTDTMKEHLHRPEIEHRHASSTPSAPPLIPTDNKSAANTQPWKQVGEWEIRYDYLDAGDGTPSGCFMSRAYRNSALRIGVH